MRKKFLFFMIYSFTLSLGFYAGILTAWANTTSHLSQVQSGRALVFDWDDTLLPTSFLKDFSNGHLDRENLQKIRDQYHSDWLEFDRLVSSLLKAFSKKYDLYIITNARLNWLKVSSSILMPKTKKFFNKLEEKGRLLSAREVFFQKRPWDESLIGVKTKKDWKPFTFFSVLSRYRHIVSIGDAEFERNALFSIPGLDKNIIKKNIKLIKRPTFYELQDQLVFLWQQWPVMVKEGEDVGVDIVIK